MFAEWATAPKYTRGPDGSLLVEPPKARRRPPEEAYAKAWANVWTLLTTDWGRYVFRTWELVVSVARYAHTPIDQVEDWPQSKLVRVARMLRDLLEREAPKVQR